MHLYTACIPVVVVAAAQAVHTSGRENSETADGQVQFISSNHTITDVDHGFFLRIFDHMVKYRICILTAT